MLVTLCSAAKSFGAELIFEGVGLTVNEGDKIGFIGANGAGKTTLLNVLSGEISPDEGSVSKKTGLSIGYLKQNSGLLSDRTIMEEMQSVFGAALLARDKMEALSKRMASEPSGALAKEYAQAEESFDVNGGYHMEVNIKKILNGMGFADKDATMRAGSMSGGEKTRLALAKLLLMKPDLLILDEPTNHLDFKTLQWLETYLADYKGAMLIVSHDRYFLDKVVRKIWEMEDHAVEEYNGNYSAYKIQKAERTAYLIKEYKKQSNRIESMEEYIRRNGTRASTAMRARSRVKQLAHMEVMKKPRTRQKAPSFSFTFSKQPAADVLFVKDLALMVGGDNLIIAEDISFELKRGERGAVIGANGTGKSTLLNTLLQKPPGSPGEVVWGKNTQAGYYDQENKDMKPGLSAMDELRRRYPSLPENTVRSLLGRVLLTGDDAFKRVSTLSGGERAKLGLAILMAGEYNVLILDEPTNHLDLPAREKLEEALKEYEGTLLFVSHDRYFVNALAGSILEMENKRLVMYPGGFDSYTDKKAQAQQPPAEVREQEEKQGARQSAKEARRDKAQARQKLYELETEIAALEEEEREINHLIASCPADYTLLQEKCARLEEIKARHERLMEEWMELG